MPELLRRLNLFLDQVDKSLVDITEPSGTTETVSAIDIAGKTFQLNVQDGQISSITYP